MKKSLFFAAAAAALLASCEKQDGKSTNEEYVPYEIGVKAVSGPTKSAINGTTFPVAYDMLVAAWRNIDDDVAGDDEASNYFENIHFSAPAGSAVWKGMSPKYWPLTGTLDLLCIASSGLNTQAAGVVPSCTWGPTCVAQKVIVAVPDNSAKFDDILFGAANAQTYVATGNAISFKHAETAVVFTAKSNVAYDAVKNLGVTIDGITVNDAYCSGTLTVENPAAAGGTGTLAASWSNLASQKSYLNARVWDSATNGTSATENVLTGLNLATTSASLTAKPFGEAYVILPEQPACAFTVTYTIHNGFKGDGATALNNQLQYKYVPASGTWEQGKKYVYDIKFNLNEITIAPSVVGWTDQTAVDIPVLND